MYRVKQGFQTGTVLSVNLYRPKMFSLFYTLLKMKCHHNAVYNAGGENKCYMMLRCLRKSISEISTRGKQEIIVGLKTYNNLSFQKSVFLVNVRLLETAKFEIWTLKNIHGSEKVCFSHN